MRLQGRYETEDLVLTLSHPSLAGRVAAYYQRNREFLAPFDPSRDEEFFTASYQRRLLFGEVADRQEDRAYRFWISPKGDPRQLIGTISLSSVVRGAFQSCFLGYKLDRDWQGRGYMTQAVQEVTRIGFTVLGLHRIEANVMPRNLPSLRVLEKAGYREEGRSPAYLKIQGKWEEHIHMVRLNPQETGG